MTWNEQYHLLHSEIASSSDDLQLYVNIGKDILKIIQDKGISSKEVTIMTKSEAEQLMKVCITNNRWRKARQHLKLYGSGMPCLEAKVIYHRRRIEEKAFQDFVKWLNTSDILQNLACGEKS